MGSQFFARHSGSGAQDFLFLLYSINDTETLHIKISNHWLEGLNLIQNVKISPFYF